MPILQRGAYVIEVLHVFWTRHCHEKQASSPATRTASMRYRRNGLMVTANRSTMETTMVAGVFDVTQLNLIRDAHLDWCAVNTVEPTSVLGEEAVAYLLRAYGAGCDSPQEMIASLDRHISERASHVQLGSPAIPSSGDER